MISSKKLSIIPPEELVEQREKLSITPTTFKERQREEGSPTYIDKYTYKDNEVSHFSIEAETIENSIKNEVGKKIKLSISANSSTFQKGVKDIELSSFEKDLLGKSIDYLLSADKDVKTVLIDIFAREGGQIRFNQNIPEIHTVVLYKNKPNEAQKHEVLVIDPSNFRFSSHLGNNVNYQHITNAKLDSIKVSYDNKKIYVPGKATSIDIENTGPSSLQYRDCVDIAVKIAFGLNKEEIVNLSTVNKLETIQEITNQQEVNENLLIFKESATRIRQATDNDVRKLANKLITNLDKQLNSIRKYPNSDDLELSILEKNKTIITAQYEFNNYKVGIDDLRKLHKENAEAFKSHIDGIEIELQGEISTYMEGE